MHLAFSFQSWLKRVRDLLSGVTTHKRPPIRNEPAPRKPQTRTWRPTLHQLEERLSGTPMGGSPVGSAVAGAATVALAATALMRVQSERLEVPHGTAENAGAGGGSVALAQVGPTEPAAWTAAPVEVSWGHSPFDQSLFTDLDEHFAQEGAEAASSAGALAAAGTTPETGGGSAAADLFAPGLALALGSSASLADGSSDTQSGAGGMAGHRGSYLPDSLAANSTTATPRGMSASDSSLSNPGNAAHATNVSRPADGPDELLNAASVRPSTLPPTTAGTPAAAPPGVTIVETDGSTYTVEGGTIDTYTVVLNSRPTAPVTVTLTPDDQVTTDRTHLVFDATNWNQPQTVTVIAVDDTVEEGHHSGVIRHTVSSADPHYNGIAVAPLTVQVDNAEPVVLASVRYRSFANTPGDEIYLGPGDTGNPANRVAQQYGWYTNPADPGEYDFTFEYDANPLAPKLKTTLTPVDTPGDPTTLTYNLTGLLGTASAFEIIVADRDAGAQNDFLDLNVEGQDLGDFLGKDNFRFYMFAIPAGMNFADGFSFTGRIRLAGPFSSSQENSRLEIKVLGNVTPKPEIVTNKEPALDCGCKPMPPGVLGDPQDTGYHQVYLNDGESTQVRTDLSIPGRGLDWEFTRVYRSGVQFDGPLGQNWDFADNRRLREVNPFNLDEIKLSFPNGQVGDVVRMDGLNRADVYTKNPDGSYTSPNGFFTELTKNPDGRFTELNNDGMQWDYAPANPFGVARITSKTDRNGNALTYEYNNLDQLARVKDTLGRTITYTFNSAGRLASVTDFFNRTVVFSYNAVGDLTAVRSPIVTGTPNGCDFPAGKTEQYTYSSGFVDERLNHNLLTVTAPNEVAVGGPPRVVFTYNTTFGSDSYDFVTTQALGGTNANGVAAGGTISYAYQILASPPPGDFTTVASRTTVTDRNGNLTVYDHNRNGNIVRYEEVTNRNIRASDPASFVSFFTWNKDYQLIQEIKHEGNVVNYVYDSGNADRRQQGNILTVTMLPDADRGADQNFRTTSSTFEPLFNGLKTFTEPRGNDPSYVPQNGGVQSAARYTTVYTFDYQEGTDFAGLGAKLGLTALEVQNLLSAAGIAMGLGDVNGDGVTNQINGNVIRIQQPTVTLLPGSNQAAVEGDTQQEIISLFAFNQFGQLTQTRDAESNVSTLEYYSERDPNGDGVIDNPTGNAVTGGYLKQTVQDTVSDPLRNSGTNPTPVGIRTTFLYDQVGNATRVIDGRGIATDFVYNQLNQVVQIVHAAAHGLYGADPNEPLPLTDFAYLERFCYDFNNNLVLHQVEDRGNTSNVDGDLPGEDHDPLGGLAFVDKQILYDILDKPIEIKEEVRNGANPEFLSTKLRYDRNDLLALTIQPAGNAVASVYDERDLVFQTTVGALTAPALALLALADPTNYNVRGGIASTVTFHYDGNRNLIESVDAEDTDGATANNSDRGGAGDRTRYRFNGFDELVSVIDSVRNQQVFQHDPAGNVVRTLSFGPNGGASLTNDGPDALGGPVSSLGVVQTANLVTTNLLAATEFSFDELHRNYQVDQVLFVNPTNTTRAANVDDGALDIGKLDLTPDDYQAIPGITNVLTSGTSTGGNSATTLRDTSKAWGSNAFKNRIVRIVSGTGAGQVRRIASNNGNTLTLDSAWTVTPDATSTYEVLFIHGRVTTRAEFDKNSRTTFTVEDDGDVSRIFHDGANRVIKTLDAEGNTVEIAYDDNGNVIETRETDVAQLAGVANEIFVTTSFHDSLDRVQTTVNNLGHTFDYRYDSRGNLVAMADASGPAGPAMARRAFAGGALTVNTTNLFGNVTLFDYDGLNRLLEQEVILTASGQGDGIHIGATLEGVKTTTPTPDVTQGGGDGIIRTGFVWDQNSLQAALLDDNGNVTVYLHDNQNRTVAETKGATVNTTLNKTTILGSRQIVTPTRTTLNNPAFIAAALIDTQLAQTEARIDLVASQFPPLADVTPPPTTIVVGFDPDSNVVFREDENDSEVFTKFDAVNRAIAVRVFRAAQADSHVGDSLFAPNPVSDPANVTNPTIVVGTTKQNFQYDGLSRLTQGTDNGNPTTTADDSTIQFSYDSLNRVIEERQKIGSLSTKAIDSAWRAEDLRTQLVYPNGRAVQFTFDKLDRIKTVKDSGASTALVTYNYIGTGRVLERRHQNGTRETFLDNSGTQDVGYDGLRRPVQLRHVRADNSLIVGFTHTYDRMSNKLTEGKLHDVPNSETYAYDSTYRLVSFARGVGGIAPLQGDWALDGLGNPEQIDAETRQHSSFNELTQRNGAPLLYDDNGNLVDDGEFTYAWDFANRLVSVIRKADGLTVGAYLYDSAGRRIRKVVTNSGSLNGTTDFYLDGWREIEERNGSDALTQQYVYGNYIDEPVVMDRNLGGGSTATGAGDQRLFYHQNSLFSVFALTDNVAAIKEGYLYEAYGQHTVYLPGANGVVNFGGDDVLVVDGASGLANPFVFTGRRFDAESELHYFRFRYFSTVHNRFLSRDPNGPDSFNNLYSYVVSAPISAVDPFGLSPGIAYVGITARTIISALTTRVNPTTPANTGGNFVPWARGKIAPNAASALGNPVVGPALRGVDWFERNIKMPIVKYAYQQIISIPGINYLDAIGININVQVSIPLRPFKSLLGRPTQWFVTQADGVIDRFAPQVGIPACGYLAKYLAPVYGFLFQHANIAFEGGIQQVYFKQSDTVGQFVTYGVGPDYNPQSDFSGGGWGFNLNVGFVGAVNAADPGDWQGDSHNIDLSYVTKRGIGGYLEYFSPWINPKNIHGGGFGLTFGTSGPEATWLLQRTETWLTF
ncbi:MAG: hypothetical protein JNM56_02755 [Planctomycetia bacterium]|nr:hypothetical protein [Planctomycetia bacterium]